MDKEAAVENAKKAGGILWIITKKICMILWTIVKWIGKALWFIIKNFKIKTTSLNG